MELGINALPLGDPLSQEEIADRLTEALIEYAPDPGEGLNVSLLGMAKYAHHQGVYDPDVMAGLLEIVCVAVGRDEKTARAESKRAVKRYFEFESVELKTDESDESHHVRRSDIPKPDIAKLRALTITTQAMGRGVKPRAMQCPENPDSIDIPDAPETHLNLFLRYLYKPTDKLSFSAEINSGKTIVVGDVLSGKDNPPSILNEGMWFRSNPIHSASGKGDIPTDKDIAQYRFILIESDVIPPEFQIPCLIALGIQPCFVISSAGRSVQAGVKVNAKSEKEFRDISEPLLNTLAVIGYDFTTKNPSRAQRAPGFLRRIKHGYQKLLHLNPGAKPVTHSDIERIKALIDKAIESPVTVGDNVFPEDITPLIEPVPSDFVEGLLTTGALSVVYGSSNVGKSFFVLDLCAHVAMGKTWRAGVDPVEVTQGGVLYIALEGGQGIKNRVLAQKFRGIIKDGADLAINSTNINLRDEKAATIIKDMILNYRARRPGGKDPVLIVIDTLSRAFGGGNENSAEDMTSVIMNIDVIRQMTGAHIMVIHHSGKDELRGARGHTSLRAATDTEIELFKVEGSETITAEVRKQRDLETRAAMPFILDPVPLYTNARKKTVTSCVVNHLPSTESMSKKSVLSRKHLENYDRLLSLLPVPSITEWRKLANALEPKIYRQQFDRIMEMVKASGRCGHAVKESGEIVRLVDVLPDMTND